ncbi:MAG: hypothetical protein FJ279_07120 [Planctomycetes bacterium]|nr:hypothetical protein [Planctomycetota bacterium]
MAGSQEFCFCPGCTSGFQEYLKKQYGSLQELNKEWDANCSSWDQARPIALSDARRDGKCAQWTDFRLYMEEVFTDLNAFCRTEIQRIDPEAVVGFNEPQGATSYRGISWWRLLNKLDMCGLYLPRGMNHTDVPVEIARSFLKEGRQGTVFGGWIGCYGYSEEFNRCMPWRILFHGGESMWNWMGYCHDGPGGWTALTPDLVPLPYVVQHCEEINEIKRGIGKLLLHSQRVNDGIAIHYSPLSVHASTIEPSKTTIIESQKSFVYALEDIGLQYNFVANEQIEAGELERGKYKVLVLPYAQALSSAEVKKIKDFVQNGGWLITDFSPGIMDQHCKRLPSSPLQEVFGSFESGMKTNAYGKGKAVYLDNLLKDYIALRSAGNEGNTREKLKEVLALAGVKPRLKLTTPSGADLEATETVFFRNGDIEYLCVLKDYFNVKELLKKDVAIDFPYRAHVYDVRRNEYLGQVHTIKSEIAPARAKVFALLPYKVSEVSLTLDKKAYNPGDAVSHEAKIVTSTGRASMHCLRLELVGPDGQTPRHYSQNLLAQNGAHSGKILLSLNEKRGKWELTVKDIVSGVTGRRKFTVE